MKNGFEALKVLYRQFIEADNVQIVGLSGK
jgi:hypothetical protein